MDSLPLTKEELISKELIDHYDIVVICDYYRIARNILTMSQNLNKRIIIAEANGVYVRVFCDFGEEFEVLDRDGEEPAECFI